MCASSNKDRREQPQAWSLCNALFNRQILLISGCQGQPRWLAVMVAIFLLAGLSAPLGATSVDRRSGSSESVDALGISATAPLSLSGPLSKTNAHLQPGRPEAGTGVSSGGSLTRMSYELPSNTNLTWRLGGASQASASTSAAAAKGVQTETLYAAVDNRTDKMTTEMQAKTAGTHLEPQQLSGGLRGDPTGFSYAITLAVLALLGLVSVARRDVNKPKS